MTSPNKPAVLAFLLGVASVPIALAAAAGARSLGTSESYWPFDVSGIVGLEAFAISMRIPSAPLAVSVGAFSFALPVAMFSPTASGMATVMIVGGAAFVSSLVGEAVAWAVRFVRRRIRGARP